MDKKKIQIAIIVACMLGTVGILYYNFMGGSTPDIQAPTGIAPINTNPDSVIDFPNSRAKGSGPIQTPTKKVEYPAPKTFPDDSQLDLTVYNDPDLNALQNYTPVTITPEEKGRENPFLNY